MMKSTRRKVDNMSYLLIALYTLAVFSIGLFIGLALKTSIDAESFRRLEIKNRNLHRENEQLKKQQTPEVIEIRDDRREPESFFTPF